MAGRGGSWSTSTRTASPTRWTALRAQCWWPSRSWTSIGRSGWTSRPAVRWSIPRSSRRVPRERQGRLPVAGRRQEPGVARGVLAAHGALLPRHEQPVHDYQATQRPHCRDAVHRREHALPRGSRRASGSVHRLGCGRREEGVADDGALPVWSGALVTAGDVAFYGTLDGWFKAADARTGKVLWRFKVGSGVVGTRSHTPAPTASSTCRLRRDRRRLVPPGWGRPVG